MNSKFVQDYERFGDNKYRYSVIKAFFRMIKNHELAYIYWGRKNEFCKNRLTKKCTELILQKYRRKNGLELCFKNIEGGIRLIHPWGITVNAHAIIGKNVTLHKGCTIGVIESGSKAGNPIIGDGVTVFSNATVCGKIRIGNDAVIAAGAFVNFDVPEGATVIGNPGVIHYKHKRPIALGDNSEQ